MACGCGGTKCRLEPGNERHGTAGGYTNRGCRCGACREAIRQYGKAYYEANQEAVLERQKARDIANREAKREYDKARREAHGEAYRERYRAYYESHREAERERSKAYYEAHPGYWKAYCEAHPEAYRESSARRRARKKDAFIGPAFTRQQVWSRDGGACHICGKPADPNDWHLEHVIPLARGGAHSFDNCAVSHPLCNLSKGTRLLEELELHI